MNYHFIVIFKAKKASILHNKDDISLRNELQI